MSLSFTRLVFAAAVSLPAIAAAQPAPPPPPPPGSSPGYSYGAYGMTVPGWHEHEGFFLRLGVGGGYLAMSAEENGIDVSVNGPSGVFQLALGANLAPGLILFGELFGNAIVDPTVEVNGDEFDTDDASAAIAGLGVGLAYYLPSNLYFSGTVAASQLRFTQEGPGVDEEYETDIGPSLSAQIGQEWWVSDNWGLGVAAQVLLGRLSDDDEDFGGDVTWTTTGFSLLFSATFD